MVNSFAFAIFLKMPTWFEKYLKLNPNPLLLPTQTSQKLESRTNYDKNESGVVGYTCYCRKEHTSVSCLPLAVLIFKIQSYNFDFF